MTAWRIAVNRTHLLLAVPLLVLSSSSLAFAQEPEGPQTSAPAPIAPAARPALVRRVGGNDKLMVPAGSYLRGELLESKRPGRIKGRGEFRMRLNTLILPNGYTVDLTAAPRSADSGGNETMDPEGKVTGPGGKGKDVGTVATTTVTGAGIGA